jgi:hypothetical protein
MASQGAVQNNGVGSTASCKSNTRAAPATPMSNPWPNTRSMTRSNNTHTSDFPARNDFAKLLKRIARAKKKAESQARPRKERDAIRRNEVKIRKELSSVASLPSAAQS